MVELKPVEACATSGVAGRRNEEYDQVKVLFEERFQEGFTLRQAWSDQSVCIAGPATRSPSFGPT